MQTNETKMLSLVSDGVETTINATRNSDGSCHSASGTRSLVIFDYDDTLCPSSWIEHHRLRNPNATFPQNGRADLKLIDAAAHRCVSAAIETGAHVMVITNAESGWVELSAARFLPRLLLLLGQLKVVSARSAYEKFFPSNPVCWKAAAFAHEANELWKGNNALTVPQQRAILSLGDSHEERIAVKVAAELLGAACKSVKLVQYSSPLEMSRQLDRVTSSMQCMLADTKPIDLGLQRPQFQMERFCVGD